MLLLHDVAYNHYARCQAYRGLVMATVGYKYTSKEYRVVIILKRKHYMHYKLLVNLNLNFTHDCYIHHMYMGLHSWSFQEHYIPLFEICIWKHNKNGL